MAVSPNAPTFAPAGLLFTAAQRLTRMGVIVALFFPAIYAPSFALGMLAIVAADAFVS